MISSNYLFPAIRMSNQQDLVGEPTSVNFNFAAMSGALFAQEEQSFHLDDRASDGPQASLPNFPYGYVPQEIVYTSGDGLQVDSDSYPAPCPLGSGSANYSQSDLTQEQHWVSSTSVSAHSATMFTMNL
jgi:hypothetical protein